MNENLPLIYLSLLILLLGGSAIFVFQQVWKTRRTESRIAKLQEKLKKKVLRKIITSWLVFT